MDRASGFVINNDFISTIKFSTVTDDADGKDVFAYITEDDQGLQRTCQLYYIKAFGRTADVYLEVLATSQEESEFLLSNEPFKPEPDAKRATPPETLFERQIHRADLRATKLIGYAAFPPDNNDL